MSIRIEIVADDPELEDALRYLDSKKHLSYDDKKSLVDRLRETLRLCDPFDHTITEVVPPQVSLVVVDGNSQQSLLLADRRSRPGPEKQPFLEACKRS